MKHTEDDKCATCGHVLVAVEEEEESTSKGLMDLDDEEDEKESKADKKKDRLGAKSEMLESLMKALGSGDKMSSRVDVLIAEKKKKKNEDKGGD